MKKVLKWIGLGLGGVVAVGGSIVLYMGLAPLATHEVVPVDVTIEKTPKRIERGKKLVSILCSECHYNAEDQALSGKRAPYPANLGEFYSENLTQDVDSGIGSWSEGELLFYLRTTIGPDGRQRFMSSEQHMSDEDINSIIAFLKSDDPLVQPKSRQFPPPSPTFLGRIIVRLVLKTPEFSREPIPDPDPSDQLAYGKYVAHAVAPCYGCHSGESLTDINMADPEASGGYMSGGRIEETPWGTKVYIPNITMDEETGLGKYSLDDFKKALREGFRPDGTPIQPPMMMLPELSDQEIEALWAYLGSLPPVHRPPKEVEHSTASEGAGDGEKAFYAYKCYSCHGHDGNGNCDLRLAHGRYPDDSRIEAWIRDPSKFQENAKMPTWDGVIAEEDYAPLVAYVRELGKRVGSGAGAE